ncbi:hydroxyectoine utilization dehydratase EutB [Sinorhizobium meliloti]|uniref:hydroxyectoine utilization dehydratase EutB n=1 Tax=Rhizobium meliloti TaxID=382 RepID=UPI000FD7A940|nr:hydroxyectoine utilization dehydratase EutB [Sinorhizobium meliloti]RVE84400.1 hydroxyectoine utilization dehydratase EutB [Sinorhizobium meliloti]
MIDLQMIRDAQSRIGGHIISTPTEPSSSLSELFQVPIVLKHEHLQKTGSFKLRGATNAILQLSDAEKATGVIAVSTGNHGRALAHAARAVGSKATICMSELVPQNKVSEIRRLGADVRIIGQSQDEALHEVDRLVTEHELVEIPPFDHPDIIAGQGTIGLDIIEALPNVETVLVPVSGGGLAAGIAVAVKSLLPNAKIIGVSMERGAAMKASLTAGKPIQVEERRSFADALGGGIGLDNNLTLRLCQQLLDDVILLTEEEIAAGIRYAYHEEREVLEGSGAVGIAALISGKIGHLSGPVAVVLSGRNIAMDLHRQILNGKIDPNQEAF